MKVILEENKSDPQPHTVTVIGQNTTYTFRFIQASDAFKMALEYYTRNMAHPEKMREFHAKTVAGYEAQPDLLFAGWKNPKSTQS